MDELMICCTVNAIKNKVRIFLSHKNPIVFVKRNTPVFSISQKL